MKGNRAKVMDRWYGDNRNSRYRHGERAPFKGEPQYTLDQLFITPFTHVLTEDGAGRKEYTPIERNLSPTGIHVLDAYLQRLHRGDFDVAVFCASYNARTQDLNGLMFLLTGMSNLAFRNRWQLRTADLLLRHTDMNIEEIALRCGAGTRTNLYFIYERELDMSPTDRRNQLRRPGDLEKYRIEEKKQS